MEYVRKHIIGTEVSKVDRGFPDKAKMLYGMKMAIKEAREAYRSGTYPIGAVIVNPSGEVIGRGRNQIYSKGDYTSHAEVEAIRSAGGRLMKGGNLSNCTLYTTMEPCLMCSGAILLARIHNVVWLISNKDHGALSHLKENKEHPLSTFYQDRLSPLTIRCFDDCFDDRTNEKWKQEMEELMEKWQKKKEENSPEELLRRHLFHHEQPLVHLLRSFRGWDATLGNG